MSYRYYKIGLIPDEFNNAFNLFVKDDNNFFKVLDIISKKTKVEIYKKYNKMSLMNKKKFNYVVVNVDGDNLDKKSISLVFSDYLNAINIKSRKIFASGLYLIFVIFKTDKVNTDLINFVENGFNSNKKGRYDRYVTIPVVYEKSKETLYIGCYSGNKLESEWFEKDMVVWILEELQKNDIKVNKVGLVKSAKEEKVSVSSSLNYENIYNINMLLKLEHEKKIKCLFLLIITPFLFRFIHNKILFIFLCLILILVGFSFFREYKRKLYKIDKIKLSSSNIYDFKEKLNYILEKYYKNQLGYFIIIDKYSSLDLEQKLNNKKNYIILIDNFNEKEIFNIINKTNDILKKNILVLKKDSDEYLSFVKKDNFRMKKKVLDIMSRLL